MNSLFTRDPAVVALDPATDYSSYEGYGVTRSGDTATKSASAATAMYGVILDGGQDANSKISVGVLGGNLGCVRVKLGGTVTAGQRLQQHTDGRFVADAGSGARSLVGWANEGGDANDLVEAVLHAPIYLAS
jgi:hypothetical protein